MCQEFNHDKLISEFNGLVDTIAGKNPIKLTPDFLKNVESEINRISQGYINHHRSIPIEIRALKKKLFYIRHAKNHNEIVAIIEAPIFYDPINDAFALKYEYSPFTEFVE